MNVIWGSYMPVCYIYRSREVEKKNSIVMTHKIFVSMVVSREVVSLNFRGGFEINSSFFVGLLFSWVLQIFLLKKHL